MRGCLSLDRMNKTRGEMLGLIVCSAHVICLSLQVMLVGDSGVGKTCLLVRFKDGAFLAGSFISTVGIDFRVSRGYEIYMH